MAQLDFELWSSKNEKNLDIFLFEFQILDLNLIETSFIDSGINQCVNS